MFSPRSSASRRVGFPTTTNKLTTYFTRYVVVRYSKLMPATHHHAATPLVPSRPPTHAHAHAHG